jgi:hypothetical protein
LTHNRSMTLLYDLFLEMNFPHFEYIWSLQNYVFGLDRMKYQFLNIGFNLS